MIDLGRGWEFDLWPRYVDNLSGESIDSYVDLDARLGWRPTDSVEFSLVGQNLIDSRRKETRPGDAAADGDPGRAGRLRQDHPALLTRLPRSVPKRKS